MGCYGNTMLNNHLVQFADQFLALSTVLPGTESLYGFGEHKVSLQLKKLVIVSILCIAIYSHVDM